MRSLFFSFCSALLGVFALSLANAGCPLAGDCETDDECSVGNVCEAGECVAVGGGGEGEGEAGEGEGEAGEGEGEAGEGEGEGGEGEGEGEGEGPVITAFDAFEMAFAGATATVPLVVDGVDGVNDGGADVVLTTPPIDGCDVAVAAPGVAAIVITCAATQLGDAVVGYRVEAAIGTSNDARVVVRYVPPDWSDPLRKQRMRIAFDAAFAQEEGISALAVEGHPIFLRANTLPAAALASPRLFANGLEERIDVDENAGLFVPSPGPADVMFLYFDALPGADAALPDPFSSYQAVWHFGADGVAPRLDDSASVGPDQANPLQPVAGSAAVGLVADGVIGGALRFPAGARLGVVNPTALAVNGPGAEGTMSMWLRPADLLPADRRIGVYAVGDVFDDPDGFGFDPEIHLGLEQSDAPNGYRMGDGATVDDELDAVADVGFAEPGVWQFLAMTWRNGDITLYADDVTFAATGGAPQTQVLDTAVLIGGPINDERHILGDIDEVRISRTAVSAERLFVEQRSARSRVHVGSAQPTDVFFASVAPQALGAPQTVAPPLLRVTSEIVVIVARDPAATVDVSGELAARFAPVVVIDGADVDLDVYVGALPTAPAAAFDLSLDVITDDDAVVAVWQSFGAPERDGTAAGQSGIGPLALSFDAPVDGAWLAVVAASPPGLPHTFTPFGVAPANPSASENELPFRVDVRFIAPHLSDDPPIDGATVTGNGINESTVLLYRGGF